MKVKRKITIAFLILAAGIFILAVKFTGRSRLSLTFDADYYWPEKSFDDSVWFYEKVPAGFEYYLYIPKKYRDDRHNKDAELPLIVTFHGSNDKYASRGRFGRMFLNPKIQNIKECAVLVLHSRGDYFSDCHDVSLLIQNVILRNECLDKKNIIGFGHSQGAEFVVKLACFEPGLFKGVISGSGYYKPSFFEYLKVLPVSFYWKISKYDRGIYEQGYRTGRILSRICHNSVNVELESREHCWVEIDDDDGKLSFLEWFEKVLLF